MRTNWKRSEKCQSAKLLDPKIQINQLHFSSRELFSRNGYVLPSMYCSVSLGEEVIKSETRFRGTPIRGHFWTAFSDLE